MYRYRHARPKISFALATAMLVIIGMALTGILKIEFDLTPLDTNPQAVAVALVFSVIAALLLYEW